MPVPTIPDADLPDTNRIPPDCIWRAKREFEVFAEACNNGLRILSRFSMDPSLRQSAQIRIAAHCHERPVLDIAETFPDQKMPDVVVEIYEDAARRCRWTVSHMSVYEDYSEQLQTLAQVLDEEIPLDDYEKSLMVDIPSLDYDRTLEGRGAARLIYLIHVISDTDSRLIHKGLDYMKYLLYASEFNHWMDVCYHRYGPFVCYLPTPTSFFQRQRLLQPRRCRRMPTRLSFVALFIFTSNTLPGTESQLDWKTNSACSKSKMVFPAGFGSFSHTPRCPHLSYGYQTHQHPRR